VIPNERIIAKALIEHGTYPLGRIVAISDNCQFLGHLPKRLIALKGSMSALLCCCQLRRRSQPVDATQA
jgi:hypothetical protein